MSVEKRVAYRRKKEYRLNTVGRSRMVAPGIHIIVDWDNGFAAETAEAFKRAAEQIAQEIVDSGRTP